MSATFVSPSNSFFMTVERLLLNDLYKASKSIHKKYQFMQFTDADGNLLQGTKVRLEDEKGNMFGTASFDMKSEHPVVYHFVDGVLDSDGNEPAIESPNHYEIWRKGLIEKVWTDGGDTIEYWEKGVPIRIETNVIQRRKNGEAI